MESPRPQANALGRSFTALNEDNTLIVVIEMGQSRGLPQAWSQRQPLKKLDSGANQRLKRMNRWRHEALQAGPVIERGVAAYEPGREGFWLARRLRARGVEVYVMHPASVAV